MILQLQLILMPNVTIQGAVLANPLDIAALAYIESTCFLRLPVVGKTIYLLVEWDTFLNFYQISR